MIIASIEELYLEISFVILGSVILVRETDEFSLFFVMGVFILGVPYL
jgi:hypothetical protein